MAYICLSILLIISLWCYIFGRWASRKGPRVIAPLLILSWALLLAYIFLITRPEVEYHLLAWSPYIFIRGALYLPFAALFVGVTVRALPLRSARALHGLIIFLAVVGIYDFRWGLWRTQYLNLQGRHDRQGICRNSLPDTTGAAACVTLARCYGISVTEGWMAEATLTRPRAGSDILGLCRGVQLALKGSKCAVAVRKLSWEKMMDLRSPALLVMRRTDAGRANTMVVFSARLDRAMVASPRKGMHLVDRFFLQRFWSGYAIVVTPPSYWRPGSKPQIWV